MNPVIPLLGAIIAIVLAMYIRDLRKMYKHYTKDTTEPHESGYQDDTKDI